MQFRALDRSWYLVGGIHVAARGLTPKQQRFVAEFLVDLNATQAAIRAGYSAKTANKTGPRLLVNVGIAAAISAGQQARQQRTEITQDWVLERLKLEAEREGKGASHAARIAALKLLGDHTGLFDPRPSLEALLDSLPADLARAIRPVLGRLLPGG